MQKTCMIEKMAFPEPESSFESGNMEYEIEVYLKGFDFEQIRSMASSHEGQEQWGAYIPKSDNNASFGSLRVRKTIHPDGESEYEFCTKTDGGPNGKVEEPDPVRPAQLEQFKLFCDQGLIKTRYKVPGKFEDGVEFVWEIDLFTNKRGELVDWAKIDIELKEPRPGGLNVSEIPFTHEEVLVITPEEKAEGTGKHKDQIKELYEKYFRTDNVYV